MDNELEIIQRLISNSIGYSGKIVELAAQEKFQTLQENSVTEHPESDKFPPYFDMFVLEKDDQAIGELLAEFHCNQWYQLPAKPYSKHLPGNARAALEDRYSIAKTIQEHFHAQLLELYVQNVLKTSLFEDRDIDSLRAEFQRFLARLQISDQDFIRREKIYEEHVAAWDAAHKLTSHPGAHEIQRILTALRDKNGTRGGWSAWPATHKPAEDKINGDRKPATISDDDVDAGILYTAGETYGVFYRHQDIRDKTCLSLKTVYRPDGFTKRAPFRFEFLYRGIAPIHIWAWHAPSDSASNAVARSVDFLHLATLIDTQCKTASDPVFLVGDFNIDTTVDDVRNCNRKLSSPDEFFGALSPEDPRDSLFWGSKTSLKQSIVSTYDEDSSLCMESIPFSDAPEKELRFDLTASAFDWVLACGGTSQKLALDWETIVPVYMMLASRDESGRMYLDSPGMRRQRSTYMLTAIPGLAGCLGSKPASDPYLYKPTEIAADLLRRSIRISDHLPVASRFSVPRIKPKQCAVLGRGMGATAKGSGYLSDGEFDSVFSFFGGSGYSNIGGGDCLFHAILHMIESRMAEFEGGVDPYPIVLPPGTGQDDGDLLTRIAALRQLVHDEILANPWTYFWFRTIDSPELSQIAFDLNQLGSWDHIGGDIAPLAIANVLRARFGIRNSTTGAIQPINPRGDDGADLGDAPYINYNGHNHYW
jgi:hypothetical protein